MLSLFEVSDTETQWGSEIYCILCHMEGLYRSVNIKGHSPLASLMSHILTFSSYFELPHFLCWLSHNLASLWDLLVSSTFFILIFQVIVFIPKILYIGDTQLTYITQNCPLVHPYIYTFLFNTCTWMLQKHLNFIMFKRKLLSFSVSVPVYSISFFFF